MILYRLINENFNFLSEYCIVMGIIRWSLFIAIIIAASGFGFCCPVVCKCNSLKARISDHVDNSQRVVCSRDTLTSLADLDMEAMPSDTAYLILRENHLTVIHHGAFVSLPGLLKLDLSINQITEIQDGAFLNLTQLQKLDLSQNKLVSLLVETFNGLSALQRLDLSKNKLVTLFSESFDRLNGLQRLNLADNPLICDCHLRWLVEWTISRHIRLSQETVCHFPSPLRGTSITHVAKKDMHCDWPVQLPVFDLDPRVDQLVFEGDPLMFRCQVSNIEHNTQLMWMLDGRTVTSDPLGTVAIETQISADGSTLISSLIIEQLQSGHSGAWMCYIETSRGNESRSTQLVVISENSSCCPRTVTSDNKGEYIWPETLAGITVELECIGTSPVGLNFHTTYAYHTCTNQGVWENLDTTLCPYTSEVTKVLEQFAKTNFTLSKTNVLDSARGLRNYTGDSTILKDKMDVVFISHTIHNYVQFVHHYKEMAEILVDVVNTVMSVDRRLLRAAQAEDGACSRLVQVLEQLPEILSEGTLNRYRDNLAIEEFFIKSDVFPGMTCISLKKSMDLTFDVKQNHGRNLKAEDNSGDDKVLHCNMVNVSKLNTSSKDKMLEAYIQLPSTLFHHPELKVSSLQGPSHKLQFIIYHSSALFPRPPEQSRPFEVSSSVIASKIANVTIQNLTDPVTVVLQTPAYTPDIIPVWWNHLAAGGQGDWSSEGCAVLSVQGNLVTFSCYHLASYGLLQDVEALILQYDRQKTNFHLCHPAIYVGSILCISGLKFSVFTYCCAFRQLRMPKRTKHSLINTWLAMSMLCLIFTVGVHQTDFIPLCQGVGLLLHYLTLCTLLWMVITASNLYKKLTKTEPPDPSPDEPLPDHMLPPKPMLRFYLVGWGVSTIVCGISAAVHLENYGGHTYCFLSFNPSLAVFYGPAGVLVFFLIIFYLLISCVLYSNSKADCLRLSENLPITENVVMELTQPCASGSCSQNDSTDSLDDPEYSHQSQLRAHTMLLLLFLLTWASAAFATGRPFVNSLFADELIFSLLYCLFSTLIGLFVFSFFCYSRKDAHHCLTVWWFKSLRKPADQENDITESVAMVVESEATVQSTQSLHSSVQNKNKLPYTGSKSSNPNLLPPSCFDHSVSGAEMFYDPRQSVVARRFFEKNRRQQQLRQLQKSNLEKVATTVPFDKNLETQNPKNIQNLNSIDRTESSHKSFSGEEKDNKDCLKCNMQSCQAHEWIKCSSLSKLHSNIKRNLHCPTVGVASCSKQVSSPYQKTSCSEFVNTHPPSTIVSHSCCSDLTDISHSRHRPRSRHRSKKRQHSWDGRCRSSGRNRSSLSHVKLPPNSLNENKFESDKWEYHVPRSHSAYEQAVIKQNIDNIYSCSLSDHSAECSGRQQQEVCI